MKTHTALSRILEAARKQQGPEPSQTLGDSLNALVDLPPDERSNVQIGLARMLAEVTSPAGAGLLTVYLGGAVEGGMDPLPAIPFILKAFLALCDRIETGSENTDQLPELEEQLAIGLRYMGQGLVAHLARCPDECRKLGSDVGILEKLEKAENITPGALWVLELIRKCSGEIMVLHGIVQKGIHVRYENISNCFHLFTLLQAALEGRMDGSKRVDKNVLSIALGETSGDCLDSAWWHYGRGDCPKPDIMASVFGEMSPCTIPEINDRQVMILWPPILKSRTWDAGFFGPYIEAVPPRVNIIEELSVERAKEWRCRIGLKAEERKPAWWKFW